MSQELASTTTQCSHCGLSMPKTSVQDGPVFCCVGCEAVYYAIHASGLDDFYRLRTMTNSERGPVGEVSQRQDQALEAQFDISELIEEHTQLCEDGTREVNLYLDGVHCVGCVWLTEQLPNYVSGVQQASLDLSRSRLHIRWSPETTPLSAAIRWLTQFGYSAHWVREERIGKRSQAERQLLIRVGVCWALAANIMLLAVAMYAGMDMDAEPQLAAAARWLSLGLSAISVTYGGSVFYRRAWTSIRAAWRMPGVRALQALSMDVPISLGVLVGFIHSAFATVSGQGEVWFDSIAVLIAALLTARWLQLRGKRFATDAAERLLSILPSTARRVVSTDGTTESIPSRLLNVGDIIEVRAGEIIAADGVVDSGASMVHRAVLTGESRPEVIAVGGEVEAGVTNLQSVLRIRVTAAGSSTRVGKLLHWIEDRGAHRTPFVQLVDRMGGVFVFVVLIAALVTGVVWWFVDPSHAVSHVVALLVISCPCALGMGTPLALSVGVGQAARRGIYIKHDDVIELLSKAKYVIFDKTGTLTDGNMGIAKIHGCEEAVRLASVLEMQSNHPISHAFVQWAKAKFGENFAPCGETFAQEIPASGMQGHVEGRDVVVGRFDWAKGLDAMQCRDDMAPMVLHFAARGFTPVVVSVDNEIKAVVAIGDTLRPHSVELIQSLQRQGVQTVLLSGDHPTLVQSTASALGIAPEYALGGVSPEGKRAYVSDLKKRDDAIVVMVGDGVNDAVALQEADIGIAVNGGAEASLVAADIFITASGVEPVLELVEGAKSVMRVVHRNLAGSAIYNALGITFASLGFVAPLLAAVAMPISSLAVVVSSLVQKSFPVNRVTQNPQIEQDYGSSLRSHTLGLDIGR